MKTVLLTGFEPFGDYKHNPTQDLVNYISKKEPRISQCFIYGIVLPCTYKGAFEILSKEIRKGTRHPFPFRTLFGQINQRVNFFLLTIKNKSK